MRSTIAKYKYFKEYARERSEIMYFIKTNLCYLYALVKVNPHPPNPGQGGGNVGLGITFVKQWCPRGWG